MEQEYKLNMEQQTFESPTVLSSCLVCGSDSPPSFYPCCLAPACSACHSALHSCSTPHTPITDKCDRCTGQATHFFFCSKCNNRLCASCSKQMHSGIKFKDHTLIPTSNKLKSDSFQPLQFAEYYGNSAKESFQSTIKYNCTYQALRQIFGLKKHELEAKQKEINLLKQQLQEEVARLKEIIEDRHSHIRFKLEQSIMKYVPKQLLEEGNSLEKQFLHYEPHNNEALNLIYKEKLQSWLIRTADLSRVCDLQLTKLNHSRLDDLLRSFALSKKHTTTSTTTNTTTTNTTTTNRHDLNTNKSHSRSKSKECSQNLRKENKNVSCKKDIANDKKADFEYFVKKSNGMSHNQSINKTFTNNVANTNSVYTVNNISTELSRKNSIREDKKQIIINQLDKNNQEECCQIKTSTDNYQLEHNYTKTQRQTKNSPYDSNKKPKPNANNVDNDSSLNEYKNKILNHNINDNKQTKAEAKSHTNNNSRRKLGVQKIFNASLNSSQKKIITEKNTINQKLSNNQNQIKATEAMKSSLHTSICKNQKLCQIFDKANKIIHQTNLNTKNIFKIEDPKPQHYLSNCDSKSSASKHNLQMTNSIKDQNTGSALKSSKSKLINNVSLLKITEKSSVISPLQTERSVDLSTFNNKPSIILQEPMVQKIYSIQEISERFASRKALRGKNSNEMGSTSSLLNGQGSSIEAASSQESTNKRSINLNKKDSINSINSFNSQQMSPKNEISSANTLEIDAISMNAATVNASSTNAFSNSKGKGKDMIRESIQECATEYLNECMTDGKEYGYVNECVTEGSKKKTLLQSIAKEHESISINIDANNTTPNESPSLKRKKRNSGVELENKQPTPPGKITHYKKNNHLINPYERIKNKNTPENIKNVFPHKISKDLQVKGSISKQMLQSAPNLIDQIVNQPKKKLEYIELRDRMKKPMLFKAK